MFNNQLSFIVGSARFELCPMRPRHMCFRFTPHFRWWYF